MRPNKPRTTGETASISLASAPLGTRTVMAPITISIEAKRHSRAVSLGCVDSIDTTGTKAGIPSAGSAKRPSLAALIQFDRCCGARSCRRATSAIAAPGAVASANDPAFLLSTPASPPNHARYFSVAPNVVALILAGG